MISAEKQLQFLAQKYKLSLGNVLEEMINMERKDILKQHPHAITCTNGRYRTVVALRPEEENTTSEKKRHTRQIAKTSKSDLEDVLVKFYKAREKQQSRSAFTLRKLYPEWFDYKWDECGNSNYMKHIDLEWRKHYVNDPLIDVEIRTFTIPQLKKWARDKVRNNRMTKKQYYNMQIILRQSLDYLVESEELPSNPFKGFTMNPNLFVPTPVKAPEEEVFTPEEERQMKAIALKDFKENPKRTSYLLVPINFALGLRESELVSLQWKDLQPPYIYIRRMEVTGFKRHSDGSMQEYIEVVDRLKKNASPRRLYVAKYALKLFEEIKCSNRENGYSCEPNDYIFVHNHQRITANSVDWYYEKYCGKLGIKKRGNHKARKTALTKLADNPDFNLKDAMEFAGHKDVKTFVKHYCFSRYSDDYKCEQQEKSLGDDSILDCM